MLWHFLVPHLLFLPSLHLFRLCLSWEGDVVLRGIHTHILLCLVFCVDGRVRNNVGSREWIEYQIGHILLQFGGSGLHHIGILRPAMKHNDCPFHCSRQPLHDCFVI